MRLLRHCPPGTHRRYVLERARKYAIKERENARRIYEEEYIEKLARKKARDLRLALDLCCGRRFLFRAG